MANKAAVVTNSAPKLDTTVLNQAIIANGFVFVSGALPIDPESGNLVDGDIHAHTVSLR